MTARFRFIRQASLGLCLALAPSAPALALAAPASFLIVNPAGRGNQGMADSFLTDFAKAVTSAWPAGSTSTCPPLRGRYHVSTADALASIHRDRPLVALVSPAFYLENRESLDLHVLAFPLRKEGDSVVHILARDGGAPASPPRVGGQLAGEPGWLMGVVIGQDHPWLVGEPLLVPVAKTLEAVRMAEAGQLDFVAVHDSEWLLLQRSGKARGWHVVATSPRLPEGPVVSLGEPGSDARAMAAAMASLSGTDLGQDVLARMTLRGFSLASEHSLLESPMKESAERLAAWTRLRAAASAPKAPVAGSSR